MKEKEPDDESGLWKKASWRTRQDILFVVEAMKDPERWERASNYADGLRQELSGRKGSRADQDLIELFLTRIYPAWHGEYVQSTRAMLKQARARFDALTWAEQGRLRDAAGGQRSHLDLMGVPLIQTERMREIIGQIRRLSNEEKLSEVHKPRFLESPARRAAAGIPAAESGAGGPAVGE